MSEHEKQSTTQGGFEFSWDPDDGLFLIMSRPVMCSWTETTMAYFMSGLHKMVGTDRFNLALYAAGEDTSRSEWERFVPAGASAQEGLRAICDAAPHLGRGIWQLLSFDPVRKEIRIRAKNTWESMYQKSLGVCWGTSSVAGAFAGFGEHIFGQNCWTEQISFCARGDEWDEFVVRPSDRTVERQLAALIDADKASRADLDAALEQHKQEVHERKQAEERLKQEIHDRKLAEQALLDKLEIIRRQEDSIRAMSTPILQLWEGVLALPVIGLVDNARANQMMESLLEAIVKTQARFTILDLTGVDAMDTSAADHLLKVVRAARLLGTRCVMSGISPSMAQTIVGLELDLSELQSFSTLESALRFALRSPQH